MTTTIDPKIAIPNARLLQIYDAKGNIVSFESVLSTTGPTIVVFIRHFFCGMCKMYVEDLNTVKPEALSAANATLVVIGCGSHEAIPQYIKDTGFKGDMYADQDRVLYKAFGMIETLAGAPKGEKRKSYLKQGRFTNILMNIGRALKTPSLIGKQGSISQLGGDFVFDADKELVFCSIMKHVEDHVEVVDLMKHAGVVV